MKESIKRFYIMPAVWRTVTVSQVFNWVRIFNDHNISTDVISLTDPKREQSETQKEEIKELIKGRFYQYRLKPMIWNELILFFRLYDFYKINKDQFKHVIFQTRMPSIGLTFFLLKIFTNSKIIFESRGATIEERKFVGGKTSIKLLIKKNIMYMSERMLLKYSDLIIVVSKALRDYYLEYLGVKKDKFLVIPGAADSKIFNFNPIGRDKIRKNLEIEENKKVIIYSGALGMKWEIPDKLFLFIKKLHAIDNDYRFIVLTPDLQIARDLARQYKLDGITFITSAQFEKVNDFLLAADLGILLREDILMNNVASPTKFSEYLLTGLPVIVSKGVNDFAELVRETGYGVVIDDLDHMPESILDKLANCMNINRKEISQWGSSNLSKESIIKKYIERLVKTCTA
jgi:glycosyltransferase involved in cell wall biosynthesis